jgi:hypothetical protein
VVVDFFLGGTGEGKRTRQGKYCRVVFGGDTRVQTAPFGLFEERPPILDALGCMHCSSWDSSTTLLHALKTVKGLLHLVPPRTPRSSGYGVFYTCVYVTCYFCYVFSLGSSSGSTGSVRVYRSVCERYTPNIYRCIPT